MPFTILYTRIQQQKWVGANEEITKKHIETVDIKRSLNEVKETVQVLNTKQREVRLFVYLCIICIL